MKKMYIKPVVEQTECVHETALLEGSTFFHAEGKGSGIWDDDENSEEDQIGNKNLWDD